MSIQKAALRATAVLATLLFFVSAALRETPKDPTRAGPPPRPTAARPVPVDFLSEARDTPQGTAATARRAGLALHDTGHAPAVARPCSRRVRLRSLAAWRNIAAHFIASTEAAVVKVAESLPLPRSTIAALLSIGGVEMNPGPPKANRRRPRDTDETDQPAPPHNSAAHQSTVVAPPASSAGSLFDWLWSSFRHLLGLGRVGTLRRISPAELLEFAVNVPWFRDPDFERPMEGRPGFFRELGDEIDNTIALLSGSTGGASASLRGFVLDGSSAIGKTFASLAFETQYEAIMGQPSPWHVVTAYLGFNRLSGLSSTEQAVLENAEKPEAAMASVIYDRLSIIVGKSFPGEYARANGLRYTPSREASAAAADRATQYAARTLDLESGKQEIDFESLGLGELSATIAQVLPAAIQTSKRIVLLVVVDEGQKLDEQIKPTAEGGKLTGGARLALRALRRLQKKVWQQAKGKVLVVPFMTGINPVTTVANWSDEGENRLIGGSDRTAIMMDYAKFRGLVSRIPDDLPGAAPGTTLAKRPHLRDRIARMLYPRVRPVIAATAQGADSIELYSPSHTGGYIEGANASVDEILHAGVSGEPIDAVRIPVFVAKYWQAGAEPSERFVLLESTTWTWACNTLNRKKASPSVPALRLPFDIKGDNAVTKTVVRSPDCYQFESLAFDVLGFVFQLTSRRGSLPLTSTALAALFAGWFPAGFVPAPASESKGKGKNTGKGKGKGKPALNSADSVVSVVTGQISTAHFHPFDGCNTHVTALAGPLSADFAQQFSHALASSRALWYHCGGSAPIDFLLLYPVGNRIWRLWMCDARHKADPSAKAGNWWPEMCDKAEKLHQALARELAKPQHGSVRLHAQWQLRIITNAQRPPPAPPESQQSWPRQLALIDRDSLQLEPWSAMLFDDLTTPS